eukprot:4981471-Alexandrium_andersonii.AAC.1
MPLKKSSATEMSPDSWDSVAVLRAREGRRVGGEGPHNGATLTHGFEFKCSDVRLMSLMSDRISKT